MNIFDNKPVIIPKWNLKIVVVPGMMINNVWSPNSQIDMKKWQLSVMLDNQCLTTITNRSTDVEFVGNFVDTSKTQQHQLEFTLQNAGNIENQLLQIKVLIEDIDISLVLENQGCYIIDNGSTKSGGEFMGENGTQRLVFTTPIYKWLLDNKSDILDNYYIN